MPWFYIRQHNNEKIRYADSYEKAYLEQFAQHNWQCKIIVAPVSTLGIKDLSTFLLELLKGLEAGLKLHQVLEHLYKGANSKKIKLIIKALDEELRQGAHFNLSFKKLVDRALHGYCDLFVSNSTPEQLQTNLACMHEQIQQLERWTARFNKTLIYPFFVIQMASIMWLANTFFQSESKLTLHINTLYYLGISLLQITVFVLLKSSQMVKLVEYSSTSFRLNKLFSLLTASIQVGNSLQKTLVILPSHFSNKVIREELLMVYYKLRLGESYTQSFPTNWFPRESLLALNASTHSGDISRALKSALQLHHESWQKQLNIVEKTGPILALIIAGMLVSKTLISVYAPLLELT